MKTLVHVISVIGLVLTVPVSESYAQGRTGSTKGRFEMSLFGGGTLDLPGASGAAGVANSSTGASATKYAIGRKVQPLWGGGVAVSVASWLWIAGDYAIAAPGERQTIAATLGSTTDARTVDRHYWTGNGAFQVTYKTVHTVMPYFEVGVGVVHDSYSATRNGGVFNIGGVLVTLPPSRVASDAANLFGPYFGGGVRIYRGERWGFRISADGGVLNRGIPQQVRAQPIIIPGLFAGLPSAESNRKGWGEFRIGVFRQFGGH